MPSTNNQRPSTLLPILLSTRPLPIPLSFGTTGDPKVEDLCSSSPRGRQAGSRLQSGERRSVDGLSVSQRWVGTLRRRTVTQRTMTANGSSWCGVRGIQGVGVSRPWDPLYVWSMRKGVCRVVLFCLVDPKGCGVVWVRTGHRWIYSSQCYSFPQEPQFPLLEAGCT